MKWKGAWILVENVPLWNIFGLEFRIWLIVNIFGRTLTPGDCTVTPLWPQHKTIKALTKYKWPKMIGGHLFSFSAVSISLGLYYIRMLQLDTKKWISWFFLYKIFLNKKKDNQLYFMLKCLCFFQVGRILRIDDCNWQVIWTQRL